MAALQTTTPPPLRRDQVELASEARLAEAEEAEALASVLSRAFCDDPVSQWVFPNLADRRRRLLRMYRELFLPDALRDGCCFTAPGLAGVAIWIPAGAAELSAVETLRLVPKLAGIWGVGLPRALRVMAFMESRHPEEPHAHLAFLGTDPTRQGRGVGSALLRATLGRFDCDGMPTYLEATSARNRALYLRHGYADLGRVHLPGGGPPIWRMWREPAAVPPS